MGISNTIVQASSSSNKFAETVLVEWIEETKDLYLVWVTNAVTLVEWIEETILQ